MPNNVVDLLLKTNLIDDRQHDSAMSRSRSSAGGHVIQTIAELGYATESAVARALSVELGLPRIELSQTPPEHDALVLLDARTCLDRFVLPIALRENGELLWLAMADPTDSDSIALVKRKAQKRVRPVVAGPTEILRAAARLYSSVYPQSLYQPESVDQSKLDAVEMSAIELKDESETPDAFEVVNVMDETATPLTRLAEQLGVEVPETIVRRVQQPAGEEIDLGGDTLPDGDRVVEGGDTLVDEAIPELEPEPTPLPAVPPQLPSRAPAAAAAQRPGPQQQRAPTGVQARVAPPRPQAQIPAPPQQPRISSPPPARPQTQTAQAPVQPAQQQRVSTPPPARPQTQSAQSQVPAARVSAPPRPQTTQPPPAADDDPLRLPELSRGRTVNDLHAEDVLTLEAIRSSMEKAALVLRAVAELCVEKGVFTPEEMGRKRQ